ncbi:zinc finger A20 and AN1 domain-containing stress-associated protein 1-like [Punica granatum]|uniref:Uncharacterized protein n=2 Tax=Punica granatum TaxID=22663 RepID=A0A218WE63_PUNGR|nr:zinc finger A20 and AN1 domain-containing stress-associated protein 1-like [Punica granatum]OWM70481.1 hypothetical protein CDL15_Pgr011957 [Punica granatum]PKI78629.1 hypothetical protein CRG98_001006 [Punica granatum]
MDAPTVPCARGCGLYGLPDQHGLCCNCYNDFLWEKIAKSLARLPDSSLVATSVDDLTAHMGKLFVSDSSVIATSVNDLTACMRKLSVSRIERSTATDSHPYDNNAASKCKRQKRTKNKCRTCSKRLGLLGFQCRCGDLFCGRHRYPEEHACKVDLKTSARKLLAKQIFQSAIRA